MGAVLSIAVYLAVSSSLSFFLLILIWVADRYEREPWHIVILTVFWGALPAVFFSCAFECSTALPLSAVAGDEAAQFVGAVVLAPVAEEVAKGLALLLVVLLFRSEFDDVLDGMVYGAAVGIGFSFAEDFLYFAGATLQSGAATGAVTFAMRNLAFVLNHSFFTALTGIGLGLGRVFHRSPRARVLWPAAGLSAAVAVHAAHNLLVQMDLPGLGLALFLHWVGGAGLVGILPFLWAAERRWVIARLGSEIREGHIPACALDVLPFSERAAVPPATAVTRWKLRKDLVELAFHRRQAEEGWTLRAGRDLETLRSSVRRAFPNSDDGV